MFEIGRTKIHNNNFSGIGNCFEHFVLVGSKEERKLKKK